MKDIRRLPLENLPPLLTQAKIGAILAAYDDLVENNRRRIALLEGAARKLYKEWFVRFRFPGHEHVKVVDGVPDGWERLTLREVATLHYGKALKEEVRIPGEVPVYGSSGIVGSHNKALVSGPGIILGRKGNVGSVRWSNYDFFPIDTVYFITSEQSDFHLYLTLQNMQFMSTDVAVPGLNRDFAYSRLLTRPEAKVAERFEDEVGPIFYQIQKLTDWNSKLAQARDLLLPKLMNGTLTV
jgi:type I restriction enzyme S subunit